MTIRIPDFGRKKALIIVDVQPTFILDRNRYILDNINYLIENGNYDLIVATVQYNESDSLWVRQGGWSDLIDSNEDLAQSISDSLQSKNHKVIRKLTRSAFDPNRSLDGILVSNGIREVHICGFESNDCVLATAHSAFDLGYYTYVIEECCETGSTPDNHKKALELLRYVHLTNNSMI